MGGGSGGGLGGRGAAASARGTTLASHGANMGARGATLAGHGDQANAMHAASAIGKHAAVEHATSKLAGTDHHYHHPFCVEPQYTATSQQYFEVCRWLPSSNPLQT
ncbi:MAG: hypothetical protein ABI356_11225 [Steroidobacteraceae bacterium]